MYLTEEDWAYNVSSPVLVVELVIPTGLNMHTAPSAFTTGPVKDSPFTILKE